MYILYTYPQSPRQNNVILNPHPPKKDVLSMILIRLWPATGQMFSIAALWPFKLETPTLEHKTTSNIYVSDEIFFTVLSAFELSWSMYKNSILTINI